MNKVFPRTFLSKRQKFVLSVIFLSAGIFVSEFVSGLGLLGMAFVLSILTIILLYSFLRRDISGSFYYPIFILPLFFTLSFALFYPLVPARFITRFSLTTLYALGLYSLFLTQNIFAVSSIRTINLLRSARIVSFVLTIVVLFFLTNIIFSVRLPFFVTPFLVFIIIFFLNFQSLWTYSLTSKLNREMVALSALIGLTCAQLSFALSLWPINAAIYSIFITGIFYSYSGLTHAWVEKRLFKGVLWEYIWVGFLSVLILIFFSKWGA